LSPVTEVLLRFVLDTNVWRVPEERSGNVDALLTYAEQGWVSLHRSDMVDVELAATPDSGKRARLLALTEPVVEVLGPAVSGTSRSALSVRASDEDAERLRRVEAALFDSIDRDTPEGRSRRIDAMHVATAMRYGYDAFVTFDGSRRKGGGILKRRAELCSAFPGFHVLSPAEALAWLQRMHQRALSRAA